MAELVNGMIVYTTEEILDIIQVALAKAYRQGYSQTKFDSPDAAIALRDELFNMEYLREFKEVVKIALDREEVSRGTITKIIPDE